MRAEPIWNNRIPFAIVFLSVPLSLSRFDTVGIGYSRLHAAYVCMDRAKGKNRNEKKKALHVPFRSFVTQCPIYGSRAIMLSVHRQKFTRRLCDRHTYLQVLVPRVFMLQYLFDSREKRRPRVKEL